MWMCHDHDHFKQDVTSAADGIMEYVWELKKGTIKKTKTIPAPYVYQERKQKAQILRSVKMKG